MKKILPLIFSGFGSETSGPGADLHQIGSMIENLTVPDGVMILNSIYKPYSVLPGNLEEFINWAEEVDYFVLVGHSFGGAAVKWLVDRLAEKGFAGKVLITCLLDAVPNTDRFGEFDPSQFSDLGARWGINRDVSPKAFQIFQRSQLFPQGSQIRTVEPAGGKSVPSHWNKWVGEIGKSADNHCDVPADPRVQVYVVAQVGTAIFESEGVPVDAPAAANTSGI